MNCPKCGAQLFAGDKFCKTCGFPVPEVSNPLMTETPAAPAVEPQPVYQQPVINNNPAPAKKSSVMPFIMALLAIGIIVLGVIFVLPKLQDDNTNDDNNNDVAKVVNYKVKVGNFTFSVPETYQYQSDATKIVVTDDETWGIAIAAVDGVYTTLLANKAVYKQKLETSGFVVDEMDEKTVDGRKYLTYNVSLDDQKAVYAYTKADASHIFGLVVANEEGTYEPALLEKVTSILNSAVYEASGNGIAIDGLDTTSLLDALK